MSGNPESALASSSDNSLLRLGRKKEVEELPEDEAKSGLMIHEMLGFGIRNLAIYND